MKTAQDCYRHAIKRARERYGVWFEFNDLLRLSEKIMNNEATHLLTESRTRTHWLVDEKYIIVYNKKLRAITTFLPPDLIHNYLGRKEERKKENKYCE